MRKRMSRRPGRGFRFEGLETRTLFNTLLVGGTAGDDTITLGLTDNGQIRVVVNGKETDYKPSDFDNIVVNGLQGEDTINVRATVIPTTVGSRGHATINIGNANGVQDIKANVTQTGFPVGPVAPGTATVNVDDTGDSGDRNVTLTKSQFGGKITDMAPADIIYDENPPVVSPAADGGAPAAPTGNSLHLTTGSGDDTVNVRFIPSDFPVTLDSSGGKDKVNVGDAGTVQGTGSALNVTNTAGQTALTIDDSNDTTARTVTLSVGPANTGVINGLTSQDVTFDAAQVSSVTIDGGSGGNTFTVNGTPTSKSGSPGGPTITINTGSGNDKVNLNATAAGTQLNVNNQGGSDTVVVSMLGVQGDVNIKGGDNGNTGDTLQLDTPSPLTEIATPLVTLTTGKVSRGPATINYAGVENLVLQGGGSFQVNGDLGPLNVDVIALSGGPTPLAVIPPVSFNSVVINTSQNLESLTIEGDTVRVAPGMDKVLNTKALTFDNGGGLDLTDNSLQVHYADTDPFHQIRSDIFGDVIRSSSADARHNLGYADSADKVVKGLGDKTVLVKFTLLGDANLDGKVGFADLLLLAQNYGRNDNANWDQGDFNYDGKVNFTDLLLLAQNYGRNLDHQQ